jgi:hypothetical protein
LAINSNLGTDVDVNRFVDSVAGLEVDVYTSNESTAAQAEYIRDGLNYVDWQNNVVKLLGSNSIRAVHVMCTINAICLDTLPEFLSSLIQLKRVYGRDRVNFTLNILRFPSFQSPLILPDAIKNQYKQQLVDWLEHNCADPVMHEHELNHLQRLVDYLDVVKTPHRETFEIPRLLNDFKQFYTQYDQRRNKNFAATFPKLAGWYEQIQVQQ